MRSSITVFFTLALFVVSVSGADAGQNKFHETFQVTPGGKLTIETDCGSLRVVGTSDNVVSVTADIKGSDKDVAGFEVTAARQGNDVAVKGKEGKHGSWPWNWSSELKVEFTIQVPRQYMLRLNTSGGDVSVSAVEGRVSGETSGGNVGISDVKGDVEFSTSGGNINVEKSSGKIHMETSGGNINVTEVTGIVDVSTSGGNVRVSAAEGKVRAKTSGGDVRVMVKGENKGVYAETTGGSIMIEVPKNIAADIEAGTTGGEVRCDLPVTMSGRFDKERISGTINGGGSMIHALTSGGNVLIKGYE